MREKSNHLEKTLASLCQNLPGSATLFEHEGFCMRPTKYCQYCKLQSDNETYLCHKQTNVYTSGTELAFT